jgi:hypothetical protein
MNKDDQPNTCGNQDHGADEAYRIAPEHGRIGRQSVSSGLLFFGSTPAAMGHDTA